MILRELIARFGFEVDEKGAKQVEKRVDDMKKGIGGLGKLLGVSLGVAGARAFFKIGQSAERAEFNVRRLAGTDFGNLRNQFKIIQQEIEGIREGASKVVTERQFDVAAAGFLKVFGRGEKQLEAFGKIFSFAAKQAIITGQEVTDIVDQIQGGIQGGGFDAFLDLPGFDVFRKQFLEFQQQAIDPGDPGGRIALQNRLKAVVGIVTGSVQDQSNALKSIPDELLEVDKATAKTKDTLEDLGKTLTTLLVPALNALNAGLDKFNELIDVAQGKKTPEGSLQEFIRGFFDPEIQPKAIKTTPARARTVGEAFPGRTPVSGEAGDIISMENTFIISSTTPESVGKEVVRIFQSELINAKRSIVKTEE